MPENYVIQPGQPGYNNKTSAPSRKISKELAQSLASRGLLLTRDGPKPDAGLRPGYGNQPIESMPSPVIKNGLYSYTPTTVDINNKRDKTGYQVSVADPQNVTLGIGPQGAQGYQTFAPGADDRAQLYLAGLISLDQMGLGYDPRINGRRYSASSPVGRVVSLIPDVYNPATGNSYINGGVYHGNLIAVDKNSSWWNSLSDIEKRAVAEHNADVVRNYGGDAQLALSFGTISAAEGQSGISRETVWIENWNAPAGSATSNLGNASGNQEEGQAASNNDGKSSTSIPNGSTSGVTTVDIPGVASNVSANGSAVGSGQINDTAETSSNLTPTDLNSWGLSALQTNNILSDTDAVARFLMQRNGTYSPSLGSQLSGPMSAMPMMYLLDNAGALSFDPGSLDATNSQSLTASLLDQVLSNEGSLNYASNFMQNQTQGSGIDPVAALQKLFMVGDPSQSSNLLTEFLGSGSQNTQIETTKNFITASLSNANPYIAGVLATLVDSLGTQYLASGGSPNGFLDWLAKNSFFGNFSVAK